MRCTDIACIPQIPTRIIITRAAAAAAVTAPMLAAHCPFSSAHLQMQMQMILALFILLLLCAPVIHLSGTILYGAHCGKQVQLPRITCIIAPNQSHLPFSIMRRQFPVIPAYAYTVHRSQGSSLDLLGLYFNGEPFCHGLLFTALSRVRGDWNSITVYAPPASSYTLTNCVKHHVLQCLQQ